jgi:hypothetical protein
LSRRVTIRHYLALLAVLCVVALGAFTYGFLCSASRIGPYPRARQVFEWARHQPTVRRMFLAVARRPEDAADLVKGAWTPIAADRLQGEPDGAEFEAVGYLSGYKPAPGMSGVTVYVPGAAYEGINLLVSGHGEEALLIDMSGNILHRWSCRFGDVFPDYADVESEDPDDPFHRDFWRRCHLYENGDLLVIYERFGLVKLDKDSNLIWAVPNGCHHDMRVVSDSVIYILTHEVRESSDLGAHGRVNEDFISILNASGRELRRVSVLEALRRSDYACFLARAYPTVDVLHTNTVQVLDGTQVSLSPVFKKGNVLTSMRELDVVAVVDMDEERVVWALSGLWRTQHQPTLLANGHLLVFDNKSCAGMSRVIELDPLTQEMVWSYDGTPENGFYSASSGAAYRLPNGNTLIVESNSGRAFEVTAENEIVWEFYNPYRAGENNELIAALFDVVRLGPDFPTDWLETGP